MHRRARRRTLSATGGAAASVAPVAHDSGPVGRSVDAAASEAGVPADLLMAIAVEEGGVHLAALRQVEADDPVPVAGALELRHGRLDTLAMGARLIGTTEDALRADTDLGTRAGARGPRRARPRSTAPAPTSRAGGPRSRRCRAWTTSTPATTPAGSSRILRTGGGFPARAGELVRLAATPGD